MTKRIIAIVFIFGCTTVAWVILGSTIFARTHSSEGKLRGMVASSWGAPQVQRPPEATYSRTVMKTVEQEVKGKKVVQRVPETITNWLPLESSRINVGFDLEHRQKGLLWYSTYRVDFSGLYSFRNTSDQEWITFKLKFPTEKAIYDDLVLQVDGQPSSILTTNDAATVTARLPAGRTAALKVAYRSHGLESWRYHFSDSVAQVRDFLLTMNTNFKDVDFPEDSMSPTEKRETPAGWELAWRYTNLLSGLEIGMIMPEKLQPGPLAGRVSFFAPVSLLFFFFLMFIITTLQDIELHPMNYFFLAAAFFSFHLLMAYLVDQISIHLAFVISSVVSIFLVVSYLRLVVGLRFAAVEAGISQLVYLVLFSYAFFLKGFTGLAITIGAIITLFVVMQVTGRIRWAEKFERRPGTSQSAP